MTSTATEVLPDLSITLPCEGAYHAKGEVGHVPDEPGAYYVTPPCGSPPIVQCKSRVAYLRKLSYLKCLNCDELHEVDDYRFALI